MYTPGCKQVIERIEDKIENFKKNFLRSPKFIIISKEYYECLICYQCTTNPGSNVFIEKFQGIPLVLIPGHQEILEMTGSPKDMIIDYMKNNQ
jgi:hypothetical protein